MRFSVLSFLVTLAVASAAFSQTIDVKPSKEGALPTFRPALIGNGPTALINRIDAQGLLQKGQKDALVMFTCTVQKTGNVVWSATYRGTPDSKFLEEEVLDKLSAARFIPAVYNHSAVDAIFYGTVTFAVVDGKPRLRIFSNQEPEELKKESDFVGPQPFFGNESKFTGWHYPPKNESHLEINGAVELGLEVTEKGFVDKVSILNENPPFVGFGDAAAHDLGRARFIPAFREGRSVACKVTLPVYFKHRDEIFNARLISN